MMKKILPLILAMALLLSAALADSHVEIKPGEGDLTKDEVKALAVSFFAEKCGVEASVLREAEWTIQYGHSSVETAENAVWSVYTRHIKGHSGAHGMTLTGPGEVINWSAHTGEYDKANPGLLDYATPVKPLSSDAQADAVIALVREEMMKQGFVADAAALTITPTFAYDEHFNIGFIPVWLALIEDSQGGQWKAAVTHKGEMLSLVPYAQVFQEGMTPNEEFWGTTFKGQAYSEEKSLLNGIIECTLSHEEKAAVTARWRPMVEQWMAEHPYYLNNPGTEYLVTFARVYGIPDEKAIAQSEAEKLAGVALTERLGNAYLPNREVRVDYLVNNPEHPVWVFRFMRINGLSQEERKALAMTAPETTGMYNVTVDAYTGQVLAIETVETIY